MGIATKNYEISFTSESELEDLQSFIHCHWKANHVLATSKKLMDWQHYNPADRRYDFVTARHTPTNEIHSILGFIPISHFDPGLKSWDIWTVIWKVREGVKVPGLDMALMSYLGEQLNPRSIGAIGLSQMVIPIYKFMRYKTGSLSHYYLLNRSVEQFSLAQNVKGNIDYSGADDLTKKIIRHQKDQFLDDISGKLETAFEERLPVKSPLFLYNRYLDHPTYAYQAYSIVVGGNAVAVFIARLVEHEGSTAFRIVDVIGSPSHFSGLASEFQRLLQSCAAEYMDFYGASEDESALATSGFIKRRADDGVIIPNYFEPFVSRNVELEYAVMTKAENYCFYKGDSDQDRPNVMSED